MILKSEQEMHLYASDRESKAYKNYKVLTWEPSAAKVTKSYSRRLPALERFYRETKFSLLK